MARNYAGTPQWLPGQVTAAIDPVLYQVSLADGRVWRRHQDQFIKSTHMTDVEREPDNDFDFDRTDKTSDSTTSTSQVMQARSHWLGWSGFNLTTFTQLRFNNQ